MFLTEAQVQELRQKFGSPLFVYSECLLRQAAEQALAVPAPFGLTVRYAMKANPTRGILRKLNELGLHIDASSTFEARRAILSGFAPDRILLTAQELRAAELEPLLRQGIAVNASSFGQLKLLLQRYHMLSGRKIGLRINPGIGSGGHAKTTVGGKYAGFGIWYEDMAWAADLCEQAGVKIERLHFHVGSGSDSEKVAEATGRSLQLVRHSLPDVEALNIGGGFAVDRMRDAPAADIATVLDGVFDRLSAFAVVHKRQLRLEIEPGTFLVANAGVLLASVLDVKRSGDNLFAVLDAGMTEIMRPSLYGAQHPLTVFPRRSTNQLCTVIGHCCESGDVLTVESGDVFRPQAVHLTTVKPGDSLAIGGAGAYCSSMSAKNYNSFPEVVEVVLLENGRFWLIRKRQTLEQMLENEL